MKTLVIILSETRAHELTFDNIKKNLIDELNADLCVCIGTQKNYDTKNPFYQNAKYKFAYNEPDDFAMAFDYAYDDIMSKNIESYTKIENTNFKYAKLPDGPKSSTQNIKYLGEYKNINEYSISEQNYDKLKFDEYVFMENDFPDEKWRNQLYGIIKSDNGKGVKQNGVTSYKKPLPWREFLKIKDQFFGGVKDKYNAHPGSAGILIFFRWFLLKKLLEENLIDQYDRFVITRSDYIYLLPHPKLELLDESKMWIPDCEQYYGYTDRHVVLNKTNIVQYLDIFNCFVTKSHDYIDKLKGKQDWNLEQIIKFHLTEHRIVDTVREFPYVMYTVRGVNGKTRWKAGEFSNEHGYYIKYQTEYNKANDYLDKYKKSGVSIDEFFESII